MIVAPWRSTKHVASGWCSGATTLILFLVAINVSEHTAKITLADGDYLNLEGKQVRGMIELTVHTVDLLV